MIYRRRARAVPLADLALATADSDRQYGVAPPFWRACDRVPALGGAIVRNQGPNGLPARPEGGVKPSIRTREGEPGEEIRREHHVCIGPDQPPNDQPALGTDRIRL